jgi:hypothetical protein
LSASEVNIAGQTLAVESDIFIPKV